MSDHGVLYALLCLVAVVLLAGSCISDHEAGDSILGTLVASILAAGLLGACLLHFISGGRA